MRHSLQCHSYVYFIDVSRFIQENIQWYNYPSLTVIFTHFRNPVTFPMCSVMINEIKRSTVPAVKFISSETEILVFFENMSVYRGCCFIIEDVGL